MATTLPLPTASVFIVKTALNTFDGNNIRLCRAVSLWRHPVQSVTAKSSPRRPFNFGEIIKRALYYHTHSGLFSFYPYLIAWYRKLDRKCCDILGHFLR